MSLSKNVDSTGFRSMVGVGWEFSGAEQRREGERILLPGRVWAVPGRPRRHALVLALAFLHVFQARPAACPHPP